MLASFFIFLMTATVSFAGSLQVGPVNYFVMESTLEHNRKAGILVAVGGCIPEFIYSFLALHVGLFLQQLSGTFVAFRVITAVVLFVVGVSFFLRKSGGINTLKKQASSHFLFKGFVLGMLNPQLLPFWLIVYTSFYSFTGISIQSFSECTGFVVGTGCGAMLLHLVLIYFTDTFREQFHKWVQFPFLNRIIGSIFVLLAVLQVIWL
jgi:threonine/homoserine/homoserine lactone efflux protein